MAAATVTPAQPSAGPHDTPALIPDRQYATGEVDRLPSIFECKVHLELLEAIVHMESQVIAWGKEKGLAEGVAWDMYCTAAAHRFVEWSQKAEVYEGNTPPLDILIVWHAYMLNPAEYRRYEKKVMKGGTGLNGINWALVHRCISKDSRFIVAAKDEATVARLPFPVDLLAVLQNEDFETNYASYSPYTNFNMVAAVQRQLKFAHKMQNVTWLRSQFMNRILETAIRRYEMFFTLIAEHPDKSLSPTTDIDFIWHTHQLSPRRYALYSVIKADGRFVNHNDNLNKGTLDKAFKSTRTLFRDRFGGKYNESNSYAPIHLQDHEYIYISIKVPKVSEDTTSAMVSNATNKPNIKWSILDRQIVDGQLNPALLAIGTRGYQIQSKVLRIPDRCGIFSAGPPRALVYEARTFILAYWALIYLGVTFTFLTCPFSKMGKFNALMTALFWASFLATLVVFYAAVVFAPKNSEDQKIRLD
ncbi:hypothetical protein F4808DRAFT_468533 [Astrocystis sublimbata]|nr:hypothetical protein F4808DRAFT_468533 [Astrocystis sublimbata]